MPKWGVGLISGGILIGILLIFLGRPVYPQLSQTFRITGVVLTGLVTGGATGILLHRRADTVGAGILYGGLAGSLCFGILTLCMQLPAIPTVLLGLAEGALAGLIVQLWPIINQPPVQ